MSITWRAAKAMVVILGWTGVYYSTSAASGIWNKQLVDAGAVSPTVLTLLHLLVSLASDMAIMRYSKEGPAKFPPDHGRHTAWDIVAAFTPISVFVIMSKLATYFSYQYVSIALSHTAKASEPIFNVLVAAILFGEFHHRGVYLSLLPIALGVWMASATDFSYNHIGFIWAITSALMKVLQNIYTKRLMSGGKFTFWEIHLYCGAASLAILAPLLILQTATSATSPFEHFPAGQLLLCSMLQWASSVSSYMVLHLVSHLTFTIINVMKRMVIIIAGMLVYRQAFTPMNSAGVILSAVGILGYNIVKDAGAMPPLPTPLTSPAAWAVWLHAVLWRYEHRGSASSSDGSGTPSSAGGGNGTPAGMSSAGSAESLGDLELGGASPGGNGGNGQQHPHHLRITSPPHQSGGGVGGSGRVLAGFISPLNTPFAASFYDRAPGGILGRLGGGGKGSDDGDSDGEGPTSETVPLNDRPPLGGAGHVMRRLQLGSSGVGTMGGAGGGGGVGAAVGGGAGSDGGALGAGGLRERSHAGGDSHNAAPGTGGQQQAAVGSSSRQTPPTSPRMSPRAPGAGVHQAAAGAPSSSASGLPASPRDGVRAAVASAASGSAGRAGRSLGAPEPPARATLASAFGSSGGADEDDGLRSPVAVLGRSAGYLGAQAEPHDRSHAARWAAVGSSGSSGCGSDGGACGLDSDSFGVRASGAAASDAAPSAGDAGRGSAAGRDSFNVTENSDEDDEISERSAIAPQTGDSSCVEVAGAQWTGPARRRLSAGNSHAHQRSSACLYAQGASM